MAEGERPTSAAGVPVVETAALAAGLAAALRRAGIPGSPDRAARLAEALVLIPPVTRDRLYWTCRTVFVMSRAQLPVFDAVFSAVFDGLLDPADSRGDPNAPPAVGSEPRTRAAGEDSRPSAAADADPGPQHPAAGTGGSDSGDSPAHERETVLAMTSAEEQLHQTAFAELSEQEIAQMQALVRRIMLSTPPRRSRRSRRSNHSRDRLDVRRTLRAAQRHGVNAGELVFSRRRERARQLVLLCDVSGSMEPYTRIFLSLLQGAVAGAQSEAFVFSTRLTRLTRQLSLRNPDLALARAAAAAPDWAGGTRLAESLRRFIDEHGRRGLARGAVVVVLSDGWALDEPEQVARQMARLRRLAFRIVWVNPRRAAPGYRPLAGGMAAALPYCDAFVSGHNYAALAEVAEAIRTDRIRTDRIRTPHESKESRNAA